MTTSQIFAQAIHHHRAGHLAKAESLYRQILAAEPNHAEALHHLGIIAHQIGRHSLAAELISKSLVLASANVDAYSNLGECFRALGRPAEAISAFRRAIELQPDSPASHNNLGNALRESGQIAQAETAFQRALALKPDFAEAHNNLGNVLKDQDRLEEATATYRRALEFAPQFAETYSNLGGALTAQEKFPEAEAAYRQAIALLPTLAIAYNGLGMTLAGAGQFSEAMAAIQHALQLQPHFPEAYNNLGTAFTNQERMAEALTSYRRALTLRPEYPEAQYNLGNLFRKLGRLDEAIVAHEEALRLEPDYSDVCNNMGNTFKDLGRLDKAIAAYRRAFEIAPEHREAHSNLIYTLQYHPDYDDRMIAEEHQHWNRRFAAPLQSQLLPHTNDRDPERRLKIGYVSPDFRDQAESFFVVPLLEAHDHQSFEIHCYASVAKPDTITERHRRSADVWQDVHALSDEDLATRIREDRIDILVDLTMHMARNRLAVFSRKPAPLQVTWLAYPGTTGLPTIDYRLTDNFIDPPELATPYYSERSLHLPDCWCCYHPLTNPLPPRSNSASKGASVTFGCLNNFCKINDRTLALYSRVLQAVQDSRLILLAPEGTARVHLLGEFGKHGISADRLQFLDRLLRSDYLELYKQIDIALDTLPYNGITTTCDALWMGVPVVSLAGKTAAGRAGLSILATAGLRELAAADADAFVETAARLALDRPRLTALQAGLRDRLEHSPLMDGQRFARNVESLYRTIWRQWCTAPNPSP